VGEARGADARVRRRQLDLAALAAQRLVERRQQPIITRARARAHAPLPTVTPANRAGAQPCPTAMSCIGSPLPQLSNPHIRNASGPPTASQPAQKRGVEPV